VKLVEVAVMADEATEPVWPCARNPIDHVAAEGCAKRGHAVAVN